MNNIDFIYDDLIFGISTQEEEKGNQLNYNLQPNINQQQDVLEQNSINSCSNNIASFNQQSKNNFSSQLQQILIEFEYPIETYCVPFNLISISQISQTISNKQIAQLLLNVGLSNPQHIIYIWNEQQQYYYCLGSPPFISTFEISVNDVLIASSQQIKLKILSKNNQQVIDNNITKTSSKESCSEDQSSEFIEQQDNNNKQIKNNQRQRDREISNVLTILNQWRTMTGTLISNTNGITKSMNLNQAAQRIGVPRKTLDDYSLQIKKAKKYYFDFSKNGNQKMSYLRKFVRYSEKLDQDKENILTMTQHGFDSNIVNKMSCTKSKQLIDE